MTGILFLCTGNSCRSQMAEGFAKKMLSKNMEIFSAGLEPKGVHPMAVKIMQEIGVDISHQKSKNIPNYPHLRLPAIPPLYLHKPKPIPNTH